MTFPDRRAGVRIGSSKRILYILLGLLAAVAFLYQAHFTADTFDQVIAGHTRVRTPFRVMGYPPRIDVLEGPAASAGLAKGDEVISLDGQLVKGANTVGRVLLKHHPGDVLDVQEVHGGVRRQVKVRLAAETDETTGITDVVVALVLGMFLPWFSILLGFYVAAVRPKDLLAWIVMGLLLSFSQTITSDMSGWGDWVRLPSEIFHMTLFAVWPLFLFVFGVYFPETPPFFRRYPWIVRSVVILFVLQALVTVTANVGVSEDLRDFAAFRSLTKSIHTPFVVVSFGLVAGAFVLLGRKAWRERQPDARRRLRLLATGVIVSLTPLLVVLIIASFQHHPIDHAPPYFVLPALALLPLFPLTLAYTIVIARAMDVRLVIRQGLQYAFAKKGVVVLRSVVLVLFTLLAFQLERRLHGNLPALAGFTILLVGATLLLNLSTKRLGEWIDRRFFRDAYDAEAVLTGLSERVRTIRDAHPLVETVCQQISRTLHVDKMAVLLKREGQFTPVYASGFDSPPVVHFPESSSVIAYLAESKEAPLIYFDDENSWVYRTPGLDDEQRSRLSRLESELLLPLSAGDELLGFISAGPKRSEEPYSRSDVRVLSSVAAQTGLALENAQLTTAIAVEMAQRERMAREVEIAREVQERLFPQTLPEVNGLDYAGMCRTALGVGGDYYDFLALPDGRFGFAIGDVAGKGISAALLMASLQASLRAETAHRVYDLAALIGNLNRRVYEASTTNRYATFFYAQYNPATRRLDYVNAGHNPPMLLRKEAEGWQAQSLAASGTVIGLLPAATYEQVTLDLHPGDYLVAFTDGVSEAMNHADEEWGEEQLELTLRHCAGEGFRAEQTMHRILADADRFVAGAKQHDDITLAVFRVEA